MNLADMFINLSAEYPALLDFVLLAFAATGLMISASAVIDLMKNGKRDGGNSTGGAILAKMVGGASLIDLAFWANVWTSSLWSESSPLGIDSYSASGSGDYWNTALMAVIGFIVLAGYVVLGRAYLQITKLGYLSPDSRSDLIGSIIARVIAGSLMIISMHVSELIESSAKFTLS